MLTTPNFMVQKMQHTPLESERKMLLDAEPEARFLYALTRMVECEEVWSLGDADGWYVNEQEQGDVIAIWPYEQMAMESASGVLEGLLPQSTSLEQFVYTLLERCRDADIELEVMPLREVIGKRLSADALFDILHNMLDTGQYFLEG